MHFLLIFSLALYVASTSFSYAQVCRDRAGAIDDESDDVAADGYTLMLESLVFPTKNGQHYVIYCVRNDGRKYAYTSWKGPKPGVLAELPVARDKTNQTDPDAARSFAGNYDTKERTLEYGKSRTYGFSSDVKTIIESRRQDFESVPLVPIQATPLDVLGYGLADALEDQSLLPDYFEAYARSGDSSEFVTFGFSTVYLPLDIEELRSLARGEETEPSDSPLVEVRFAGRSRLNTDSFENTWEIDLTMPRDVVEQFKGTEILDSLGVGLSPTPFAGLDQFEAAFELKLDDLAGFGDRVGGRLVGDTTVLSLASVVQLEEWTAVLQFEGRPLAGFSFDRLAN